MKTVLALAIFLVIGLVGSHGLLARTRFRLPITVLFLTGIEFFFLGVLVGPGFLGLITEDVLVELRPVIYLALGWTGILFGIQLSRQHLKRLARGIFKVLVLDTALTLAVFLPVFILLLDRLFATSGMVDVVFAASVLGITASVNSPTIVTVLSSRLPARGRFTSMVKVTTALSAVLPLILYGLFFTISNPGFLSSGGVAHAVSWWVFANVFAGAMGLVFVLLTTQKTSRDERLLIIMGTALLVGGLCYFLKLSPLYTAMIIGVVVGNFSPRRVQIFEQLLGMERTIYVAFLVLIGAMVSVSWYLALILAAYVALRLLCKTVLSSWTIGVSFPDYAGKGVRTGLAFSAQGGVALAVALDYVVGAGGEITRTVMGVIAFSVVANEIIGVYLTRFSLRSIGDVRTTPARDEPGGGGPE